MKIPRLPFNAIVATAMVSNSTFAAVFHWDGSDSTANADGGAGVWDTLATNWDTAAVSGSSVGWPAASTSDDDAVFGGTAGSVSITPAGVVANSVTFGTAGYSLTGGSLTLDGGTPSITNDVAASIGANLIGTSGLNKIGNGTLTISGNNTGISGLLTISGATSGNNGGVTASGANSIAGFTGINIQNNSFLQLSGATIGSGVGISVAGGGGTSSPQGALRGQSGVNVVNGTVTFTNSAVRLGNLGTSTTFNGAVTAASGSGFGLIVRNSNNQGTIFTNSGNYWEGTTSIGEGSVYFHPGTLPSATNLAMAGSGNTWFESNGSFARAVGTGAGQVQFNATAGRVNGFSARGGDLTVNLGGSSGSLVWGSAGFTPAILGLAGANATGKLTWLNPISLNGASRTIDVQNGSATVDAEISAAISGGTGSVLTKTGPGTLLLSTANSHAGGTSLTGVSGALNVLRISHQNALGTGSLTIGGVGNSEQTRLEITGGITVTNTIASLASRNVLAPAILNVSGNNTLTSNISSGGGGSRITFQSDAGRLTLSGSVGVRTPTFLGDGDFLLSGNITSPASYRSLVKEGGGTLVLSGSTNATETLTTITAGTLQIGNGGTTGALGTAPVTNNATLAFNRSDLVTVANAITGSGTIEQKGTGTLEITGISNNYAGGTIVSSGTLLVNNASGSGLGSGDLVANGGVVGGNGGFTGAATINTTGVLSPGASVGTLGTGALTLNTGSTYSYELNTTATIGDLLNANGDLDLNGNVTLSLTDLGSSAVLPNGTKFTLISYSGSWNGNPFVGKPDDGTLSFSGNQWMLNYDDISAGSVNGGTYVNAVTLTVVPEPTTALFGSLGLLALIRRRR